MEKSLTIVVFGSFESDRHPRVRVLIEGLQAHGHRILTCNVPLGIGIDQRMEALRQPWRMPILVLRVISVWIRLWLRARRIDGIDAVLVGYLGVFDVHLARWIWPSVPLMLDHLAPAGETASDRRISSPLVANGLAFLDRAAAEKADLVIVDTDEHREILSDTGKHRTSVVHVGASAEWFHAPEPSDSDRLTVVFFGTFTPLQGTPVIGEAIGRLVDESIDFTMIGRGQDYEATRALARRNPNVTWIDWIEPSELPGSVRKHDVCLGIFGSGSKGLRVIPNKVFQGAASGCAIVTSASEPQRRVLGDSALFVAPADSHALAAALVSLSSDRHGLQDYRVRAYEKACQSFTAAAVLQPLVDRLSEWPVTTP